jgi:hypothetical protein
MSDTIYKDINLFTYFINNLFNYIEIANNFIIFIILLKYIYLEVLNKLDNIIIFIINIITNNSNNYMSKRINRSLPEWVFVGSILPNMIETLVH